MKKRNPIARDLHTSKYKPRVVRSKKIYDRNQERDEIMQQTQNWNLTDEGRRRGAITARKNRDITPDKGFGNVRGNYEFSKRIGKRRFDEPGMEVRFKPKK